MPGDAHNVGNGHAPAQPGDQIAAVEILHRDVRTDAGTGLVHLDDVRMVDIGDEIGFPREAPLDIRVLRRLPHRDFQRDLAANLTPGRQIDNRCRAAADLPLDLETRDLHLALRQAQIYGYLRVFLAPG